MIITVVLIVVVIIYWIYNSMKKSDSYEGFVSINCGRGKCENTTHNCDKVNGTSTCVKKPGKVKNNYGAAGAAAPVFDASVWRKAFQKPNTCNPTGACVNSFGADADECKKCA
jgi:hypothetical protein